MTFVAGASVSVYDVSNRVPESTVFAYEGEDVLQVPTNKLTPATALSPLMHYNHLLSADGMYHTYQSTTKNQFVLLRYVFQIDEVAANISRIEATWVGKGVNTSPGSKKDGANLYIWNVTTASYELLSSYSADQSLITLNGSATNLGSDYVSGAGSNLVTLLVTSTTKSNVVNDITIYTDYLSLAVTAEPSVVTLEPFNCVATGTGAISGKLYTQIAGTTMAFDVVSVIDTNSDGAADQINPAYADSGDITATVELVDTSAAGSCASYPALSPAVSTSVTFTAANDGRTAATMTVNSAYRSVACRVTDSSNSYQGCSTDSFAIRPNGFSLSASLTNAGSSGTPVAKAGDAFSLAATAVAGYDGTPSIDNGLLEAHVGAVQAGNVSGVFGAANAATGIASGAAFVYSEVGNFRFQTDGVYDDSFTAIDQPGDCSDDFSNTRTGGRFGCKFGNATNSTWVGRFTPDHFEISASNAGSLQASCNGFSYSGQAFGYVAGDVPTLTVSAMNGLSPASVTQNYTGAYNNLSVGGFAISLSSDASNLGADGLNLLAIDWVPGASLADNGDGTLTFDLASDQLTYSKNANAEVGSVTSDVDLVFTEIRDADDIVASGMPTTLQPTPIQIRFGRLALSNAYGSELLDLAVPLTAQYFAGSSIGYVTNTLDQCTSLTVADLTLTSAVETGQTDGTVQVLSGKTSQASLAFAPFTAGAAGLRFCPPGSPACSAESGNTGHINIQATAPSHLQFDWDSDGAYDDDPSARANFGLFSGTQRQIYLREVY